MGYAPGRTPACLACIRHGPAPHFGMNVELPARPKDSRMEICPYCGRPTNAGFYLEVD